MNTLSTLLHQRASLADEIRAFFRMHQVLEISTPVLSRAAVTDPAIESFRIDLGDGHDRFLRTSPEFPLKRLLSAGAPDVFELGPVFRQGENGRWHNPEFTLLEWYRRGFVMQQLADEVVQLVQTIGAGKFSRHPVCQFQYFELFQQCLDHDVRGMHANELAELARHHADAPAGDLDIDQWLDFLFSTRIQPKLVERGIVVVTHYPKSQAALAKIDPELPNCALRFEVFVGGFELANGFEELNNTADQASRFETDNNIRAVRGQNRMPIDNRFLATLDQLPNCSGVALGFDRMLMLVNDLPSMSDALALSWDKV